MVSKEVITVERFIDHPIEEVFRRYTDHEGWSEWAGFGKVRLAREGSPEFRVLWDEQEVGRCEIAAGLCRVYLP